MANTSRSNSASTKPTIIDVAREAGVSKSLVSLVIKGDQTVSVARRQAVEAAIAALNYRPNLAARNLASQRTRTIGVIITEYRNLSFVRVLEGLREVFDEFGYQVVISDLHHSPKFSKDPVDAFISMNVDAIIFIAEAAGLHTTNLSIPTVTVGLRESSVNGTDLVFSDDAAGTRMLVRHLFDLGHTHIAHLTGVGGIASNRRLAFQHEMAKLKLTGSVFGLNQETSEIGGYRGALEMLAAAGSFTAIFAANDYMAAGAISALAESGIRVPDDVSVVGYDNAPISGHYLQKLTTVDDRGFEIGRAAAEQILGRLSSEQDETYTGVRIFLEPNLVVRNSTKPLQGRDLP